MRIYFLNMALMAGLSLVFFAAKRTEWKKRLFLLACFACNFVFIALRADTVGADTRVYMDGFLVIQEATEFSQLRAIYNFEVGYALYNKILGIFFPWEHTIIIVSTLFSLGSIYYFIYRYSKNVAFSVFIFNTIGGLFQMMTFMRQYIAAGILLFSIESIKKKKFLPFLLLVLLATTFHKTSILFLLVYFVANISVTAKTITVYCLALVFLAFALDKLVMFALENIYPSYLVMTEWLNQTGGYKFIIMHAGILFAALYLKDYGEGNTRLYQIFIAVEMIQLAIFIASLRLGMISRLMVTYEPVILLVTPELVSRIKGTHMRFVISIAICILLVGLSYILLKNTYVRNIPYAFLWQS